MGPQDNNTYTGEPEHDQQVFDAAANRAWKTVLEIVAGIAIFASLLMSVIAVTQNTGTTKIITMTMPMAKTPVTAPVMTPAKTISLYVAPGWKPGPDKQLHDAFSVTNFNVQAGQPVDLKITNKDDVPHSITAAVAGVNIVAQPGTHTYVLMVKTTGKFLWYCTYPCDPWSMNHVGYMEGYITST